jgi:hypothetical protein
MPGIMVDTLGSKDPSLRQLLEQLVERMPPSSFILVDEWDDPFSIGLAAPSEVARLAYITSDRDIHGRYFMSREKPPRHDLELYHDAGSNWFANVDALASAIVEHLRGH